MKQKIVIKIQMTGRSKWFSFGCILRKSDEGKGFQTRVLEKVAETNGVLSVALEGDARDKVVVIGDGNIDATRLIRCLRKKVGHANIESLEQVKEEEEEEKIEYITPIAWTPSYYRPQFPLYDHVYYRPWT